MDKISRALSFIKSCKKLLSGEDFSYKDAYCRYRLGKYASAMSILQVMPNEPRVLTLKAQILYRTGEFSEAARLFKDLQSSSVPEMQVNFEAASALAGETIDSPSSTFEVCYNQALGLMKQFSFENASHMIDRARQSAAERFEFASLELLEIIIMICTGHDLEAASLLKKFLLNERQLSESQKAVARVNLALIEKTPLPENMALSSPQKRQFQLLKNYLQ